MSDTKLSSLIIWFPDWSRLKAKITDWEEGGGPAGDLLATKKEMDTRQNQTETPKEEQPGLFSGRLLQSSRGNTLVQHRAGGK